MLEGLTDCKPTFDDRRSPSTCTECDVGVLTPSAQPLKEHGGLTSIFVPKYEVRGVFSFSWSRKPSICLCFALPIVLFYDWERSVITDNM